MGLVADTVILPVVDARTHNGTPITIGNNRDKYVIDECIPSCDLWYRFPKFWQNLVYRDHYLVTYHRIQDKDWKPEYSFIVDSYELETALAAEQRIRELEEVIQGTPDLMLRLKWSLAETRADLAEQREQALREALDAMVHVVAAVSGRLRLEGRETKNEQLTSEGDVLAIPLTAARAALAKSKEGS